MSEHLGVTSRELQRFLTSPRTLTGYDVLTQRAISVRTEPPPRAGGQAAVSRATLDSQTVAVRLSAAANDTGTPDGRRQRLMVELARIRARHPQRLSAVIETKAAFRMRLNAGLGSDQDVEVFVLVQEYCPRSLADHLGSGHLGTRTAVALLLPLLSALAHLHRRTPAIVHRDIDPYNILVRSDSTCALIDFGYAAVNGNPVDPDTTTAIYKQGRVPPEVLGRARVHVDPKLDVWLVGRTFHDMLFGLATSPFGPDSPFGRPNHKGLERLPGPVRDVLVDMLDPTPARRPSAREAHQRLQTWLAPPPPPPPPPPSPPPLRASPPEDKFEDDPVKLRNARRLVWSLASACALLVLSLAAGSIVLFKSGWFHIDLTAAGARQFGRGTPTGSSTSGPSATAVSASEIMLPGQETLADWLSNFANVRKQVGQITTQSSINWMAHQVVNVVSPARITVTTQASFSLDCAREGTEVGGHSTIAPGPYIVHAGPPAVSGWNQDGGYWYETPEPNQSATLSLFTVEGVACMDANSVPTGSTWSTTTVGANGIWHSGAKPSRLVFPIPTAGLAEGQVRSYPGKVIAIVWIADNGDYVVGVAAQ